MFARLVLGLCAVALSAGAAMASSPPAKSGTKSNADKIVCRSVTITGSRLSRTGRVCKTSAEWAEMKRQTQQTIDRIQNTRPAESQ